MCPTIQIFVIALLVQSGLAIKCFTCDSEHTPRCANMSHPDLVARDCDYNTEMEYQTSPKYQPRIWLHQATDWRNRHLKNEVSFKWVCQKLVGTDERNYVTIVRRCNIAEAMPCNISREYTDIANRKVGCYLCGEDGCNGSTTNSVFGMLVAFVSAVAVFKHFVF